MQHINSFPSFYSIASSQSQLVAVAARKLWAATGIFMIEIDANSLSFVVGVIILLLFDAITREVSLALSMLICCAWKVESVQRTTFPWSTVVRWSTPFRFRWLDNHGACAPI